MNKKGNVVIHMEGIFSIYGIVTYLKIFGPIKEKFENFSPGASF